MQYLPKDSVRRLWKGKKADAVQITGCLQLPEQKNKRSLSDVSPERNEAQGSDTQDTQRRTLSSASMHEMWSVPGLVNLSADKEMAARRHMSNMRSGAMRSMRCDVDQRKLHGSGYIPLLQLLRREAHHMPGLQERTAGATTTATEYHEKEQTAGLHVQASAGAHTNMPTAHQI